MRARTGASAGACFAHGASARRSAAADGVRAAGSRAVAAATTAARSADTSPATGVATQPAICFASRIVRASPTNARWPVSISYSTTPTA